MITIKELHIPSVTHIGYLDEQFLPAVNEKPTRDGFGISVSTDPAFWQKAMQRNTPGIRFFNPSALWLDALAMTLEDQMALRKWMLNRRYMEAVPVWKTLVFDAETADVRDLTFLHESEACRVAGVDMQADREARLRDAGVVSEDIGYVLRPRAIKLLERYADTLDWFSAAVLLYAREVILPKRPLMVGVWWSELPDPANKSGPYGVLFPEALTEYTVETEDGDDLAFTEAFPGFVVPVRERLNYD